MKVIQRGKINPNALEKLREIQPFSEAKRVVLTRTDFLVKYLEENEPELKSKLVSKIIEKYSYLGKHDFIGSKQFDLSEFSHLKSNSELAKATLNYYLNIVEIQDNIDWLKEKVSVNEGNYLRSMLFLRYYKFQAIDELLGREITKEFLMKYITAYLAEQQKGKENAYEDVPNLYKARIQSNPDPPSEWEIYMGLLSKSKYFYRNNNCTWIDAMQELPDSELKYFVCCYGDYESVRRHNKNFILTMEHTIAQGDPYCSRVIHDTRVNWFLQHPPKEFWDNLKPTEE